MSSDGATACALPIARDEYGRFTRAEVKIGRTSGARLRMTRSVSGSVREAELAPFTPGASVQKTDDPRLGGELLAEERRRLRLELRLRGGPGEGLWLEGKAEDGRRGEVPVGGELGPAPAGADTRWYSEKLGRLGDTPFVLAELEVELPPGVSPPASALNRSRRALVRVLGDQARRRHLVRPASVEALLAEAVRPAALPPGLYVLVRGSTRSRRRSRPGPTAILPRARFGRGGRAGDGCVPPAKTLVGRVTPRIEHAGEPGGDADLWLVRSLGPLGTRAPAVADATLHASNRLSVAELLGLGARAVTPAFEVDACGLEAWIGAGFGPYIELVLYQHVPLFVTRHCLYAAHLAQARSASECGSVCRDGTLHLTDRKGAEHSVVADGNCISTIYEGQPRELRGSLADSRRRGIGRCRVELLDEPPEAVVRLVGRLRAR